MAEITDLTVLRQTFPDPGPAQKVLDALDDQALSFLAKSPFAVLATVSAAGEADASPKGDIAGFIAVEDARTVIFPERAGNNLVFGLQNILATHQASLLVVIPGTSETLRIVGRATLHDDPDLLARFAQPHRPALLAIRIAITRVYFHCARSFLRAGLWQPETWPERTRVSFGRILGPKRGVEPAAIDAFVERTYTTQLWEND